MRRGKIVERQETLQPSYILNPTPSYHVLSTSIWKRSYSLRVHMTCTTLLVTGRIPCEGCLLGSEIGETQTWCLNQGNGDRPYF